MYWYVGYRSELWQLSGFRAVMGVLGNWYQMSPCSKVLSLLGMPVVYQQSFRAEPSEGYGLR